MGVAQEDFRFRKPHCLFPSSKHSSPGSLFLTFPFLKTGSMTLQCVVPRIPSRGLFIDGNYAGNHPGPLAQWRSAVINDTARAAALQLHIQVPQDTWLSTTRPW